MGNLPGGGFFLSGDENLTRSDFDLSNLFKAKNNILEILNIDYNQVA